MRLLIQAGTTVICLILNLRGGCTAQELKTGLALQIQQETQRDIQIYPNAG